MVSLMTPSHPANPGQDPTPAAAESPSARLRAVTFALLTLALSVAAIVVCAMAASAASATGGCGGG